MGIMNTQYTEKNRTSDFQFFLDNYNDFYKKYGHKFIAIRNKEVLGTFDSDLEAIQSLQDVHPIGTFIVQECNGNESGYTNHISSWQLIGV